MTRPLRQQIELVLSLAKRDLKARYKDSVLGFFWSLLRPAFLTLVLWIVFSQFVRLEFKIGNVPYWLHVLVSILGWNFFLGSLTEATHSLPANAHLLKKVRMDAEVFPIAAILANGVHLTLALLVVLPILLISGVGLQWSILLLPIVLAVLTILVLGISFLLASTNVYYRDVGSALELGGLALFYLTPVIYPVTIAVENLNQQLGSLGSRLYMLNPVVPIITAIRRTLIYPNGGELSDKVLLNYMLIATLVSIITLILGWTVFRKLSRNFADEL